MPLEGRGRTYLFAATGDDGEVFLLKDLRDLSAGMGRPWTGGLDRFFASSCPLF
jgi:hypothetical protein